VRRSTVLLLLLLTVTGCGASDEQRIRDTVGRYGKALADGNPAKACDQIVGDDGRCEAEYTDRILTLSDDQRDALRKLTVTRVRVVGRVAEVSVKGGLLPENTRLRKEGRAWRLDPASLKQS
jgi:hypothetical protein